MNKIALYCFLMVAAVIISLAALQEFRVQKALRSMPYNSKPFVRHIPNANLKFLFIGDSTAVGTGALDNRQSVAGRFGQDFPQADIENNSFNGRTLKDLTQAFHPSQEKMYDLVVVQIGGNDIMRFTPWQEIDANISIIIQRAKSLSKHVVILHSGNVGLAPIFIWPFDWIFTHRAKDMRALYMNKAKEERVLYVDLFTQRSNDLFLKDINKYYCPDHLHPSGYGYQWWYQRIRQTLDQAGVRF